MRSKRNAGGGTLGAVLLPLAACLASAATCAGAIRLDAILERAGREDRVLARASAVSRLLHDWEKARQASPEPSTPALLAPIRKAEARLSAAFDDLDRLVADDPEQSMLLALIRRQAGRRAGLPGGPEADDKGRELLGGVRIFLASFHAAAAARRDRLGSEARTLAGSVLPGLAAGTALAAALAGLSALRLRRAVAGLDALRGESDRQERERLDLLSEAMKYYAIFSLDPEGRITTWNQDAERILGYRPAEILSRNFSALYDDEDTRRNLPQKNLAWAVQEGRSEDVRFITRKDGFRFLARVAPVATREPDGSLRGFTNVIHEIEESEA